MKKQVGVQILVVIIVFIVLVITNILIQNSHSSLHSDLGKTITRIEKAISEKEKTANENLNSLIRASKQNPKESLFGLEKFSNLSEKENISFQIYKNDSLLYWSDNKLKNQDESVIISPDSNFVKSNNRWYDIIRKKEGERTFIAAILIASDYKYENDYLVNEFNPELEISSQNIKISTSGKTDFVRNSEGKNLFSVLLVDNTGLNTVDEAFIIIFYLLEFIALLYLIYLVYKIIVLKHGRRGYKVLLYVASIVSLRVVLFYFKIPHSLYQTKFFSPIFYASSEFLPSLGDLFLNAILFFTIAVFLYQNIRLEKDVKPIGHFLSILYSFIISLFSAFLFFCLVTIIQSIVVDSTISFNLNQIFSIDGLSLTGLFVIAILLLSYFLCAAVMFKIQELLKVGSVGFFAVIGAALIVVGLLLKIHIDQSYPLVVCFILFHVIYWLFRKNGRPMFHYYEVAIYLILFTYAAYYLISVSNNFKELENRKYFAQKLSSGEDPLAEYLFKNVQKSIYNDPHLKRDLNNYPQSEEAIKEYLAKKYFAGFWDKYKVQVTICADKDSLKMQSDAGMTHCYNYFSYLADTIGRPTSCDNLYLLNYGTGGYNYLSVFNFASDSSSLRIFIELNSKFIPKGLGYPELLIDKKLFLNSDVTNYSYAKYYDGNLVDAFGKYYYSMNFSKDKLLKINDYFVFNHNGYNHLYYRVDESSFVIISKKQEGILDLFAPFSILFSFFVIVLILFVVLFKFPIKLNSIRLDFKNRLQFSMVSIILISFLIIGVSSYFFIKNLNSDKNIDILSEKSMSILIELQGKLSDVDSMTPDQQNYLTTFLGKLSNVFFTDINVFNTNGDLISSSRTQIFDEGLISNKINPTAFYQLTVEKKTFFVQKEKIGKLEYYSAYVPFYNRDNRLLYFVNLPYFAKENELKKELSSFLMAFVNIYVFFIAISIIIALFAAGRITRPLNIIREKIGNIKLGSKNEKIFWPRRDEIGGLIEEYNRMIDEITESASILARSERESAWREMAMQVAHEIKNPLTPMKLSIQYLDKAWKEQAPEWESILKRFSKNMVEQIDSLSAIASEFSYFAKMPAPQNEVFDVLPVIESSMAIFGSSDEIKLTLNCDEQESFMIFADKKQVVRVMNNLIHNAMQAIGGKPGGRIAIKAEKVEQKVLIAIKDNGGGIPEEMKEKVFMPSFSTKSEGMGLGLAIVSGIVENSGGRIWFESVSGEGTTFFIEWPGR